MLHVTWTMCLWHHCSCRSRGMPATTRPSGGPTIHDIWGQKALHKKGGKQGEVFLSLADMGS